MFSTTRRIRVYVTKAYLNIQTASLFSAASVVYNIFTQTKRLLYYYIQLSVAGFCRLIPVGMGKQA